jgi:protein associated with RNAse G/E
MKELKVTDSILPDEQVFNRIVIIRGQRVIFDYDLAELYCIEVKVLKQAVSRNLSRFPKDFMFELTENEWLNAKNSVDYNEDVSLRSQFVTLKSGNRGQHSKYKQIKWTIMIKLLKSIESLRN